MLRQARACLAASQGGQFGRGLLGMGRICPVPTQHDHILCRSKPHTKRPELGRCPPSPVAAARLTPLSSGARRPELGASPRQCLGWTSKEISHFMARQIFLALVFVWVAAMRYLSFYLTSCQQTLDRGQVRAFPALSSRQFLPRFIL